MCLMSVVDWRGGNLAEQVVAEAWLLECRGEEDADEQQQEQMRESEFQERLNVLGILTLREPRPCALSGGSRL